MNGLINTVANTPAKTQTRNHTITPVPRGGLDHETGCTSISRPNFFPGQMIDWRDFNRLASQADKVSSLLSQHLFAGGGIIVNALEEFRIEPLKGLAVMIKPGLALLANGYAVAIAGDTVVDLTPYRTGTPQTLVVSLRSMVIGKDQYIDRQDASITGYLTESIEPEVVVSAGLGAAVGIELFRVEIGPEVESLQMPDVESEWAPALSTGMIDVRHRRRIVPQTLSPLGFSQLLRIRQSLFAIAQAHQRIQRLYLCADDYQTGTYLSLLHAELLSLPFQPLKCAFLAAEFSHKLSHFLEQLVEHTARGKNEIDRANLIALVRLLEPQKGRTVLPNVSDFDFLNQTAEALKALVVFGEKNFRFVHVLEEALRDRENQSMVFDNEMLLAGHVLNRVDWVKAEQEDRYQVRNSQVLQRSLTTRYANGDSMALQGAFIRGGVIEIPFEITSDQQPAVCVVRQYVRRAGTQVAYEVNGQTLFSETWSDSELSNVWRNRGIVIPVEKLTSQGNMLRIRLERCDLDYGFFEMAVFQPEVSTGSLK